MAQGKKTRLAVPEVMDEETKGRLVSQLLYQKSSVTTFPDRTDLSPFELQPPNRRRRRPASACISLSLDLENTSLPLLPRQF